MGRVAFFLSLLLVGGVTSSPAIAQKGGLPGDLPDQASIDAFKRYWQAFDQYESNLVKEGEKKFEADSQALKEEYNKKRLKLSADEFSHLKKAEAKYKQQLADHPQADNRPFVLLNLAQILNLIGEHYAETDLDAGSTAKIEALTYLAEAEKSHPDFDEREKALYLMAIILRSLGRETDALKAWQKLANSARKSLHGVHANVAVGDYFFERDQAAPALKAYQNGKTVLEAIETQYKRRELTRIEYRLLWAGYRAGELTVVIDSATRLLSPGLDTATHDDLLKIQKDAAELLGDALYENNSFSDSKRILGRREIAQFAATAGLRTLKRYNSENIHNEATRLGEFLAENFATSLEAPHIFNVTADSYKRSGDEELYVAYLEKIGMLLPARSLWRSRYRENYSAIAEMEKLGEKAASVAADWHYDRGIASGNRKAFLASAAQYEILLAHAPNTEESNTWRLRTANCAYFSGQFDESSRMYRALKSQYKVDPNVLQIASFQLVLSDEKKWREAFAKAEAMGDKPREAAPVLAAHQELKSSVNEFAARFPGQSRSVDLLLVGANVSRDMERWQDASEFWQRVLVAGPSAAQRGLAIKGIMLATQKTGSTGDVVRTSMRFLKLEDWTSLGSPLESELKTLLADATLDEGRRLNDSGNVREGGHLLAEVATSFSSLPKHDQIYKDGAFMLALAGEWAKAQETCQTYLASSMKKVRGDMTYLLARAHEYQFRVADAAQSYLQVGLKHAGHSRAKVSLERAEKLALTDNNFSVAASAAAGLAEIAKSSSERMAHYRRAVEYIDKSEDSEEALAIARRRQQSSRSTVERFDAELLVAKMTYKRGASYEQEALDDLAILAKKVEQSRSQLGDAYGPLAGEIHFLLGEEAKRQFEDFKIVGRDGDLRSRVNQKMSYFEMLTESFSKSAQTGHPDWAPRSRYTIGVMADKLADEIAALDKHEAMDDSGNTALSGSAETKYKQTVARLRQMAKQQYSTNVLAAGKDSSQNSNEWIKKSGVRLSGYGTDETPNLIREEVPHSADADLPSQWSL